MCPSIITSPATLKSAMKRTGSASQLKKRSVRFGGLEMIQFPQVLGDNPACNDGAPLTLDWKPVEQSTMLIDYYEFTRDVRRSQRQLKETKEDRLNYLLNIGTKQEDIDQVLAIIDKIKKERAESQKGGSPKKFLKSPLKAMNSAIKSVTKQPSKLLQVIDAANVRSRSE